MSALVVRFFNPRAANMSTASKPQYPPYRCAVCGRFGYYYDGHCAMGIGLWEWEDHLGRVCPTCQDRLARAGAITEGTLTGLCYVRPDYRLRLRARVSERDREAAGSRSGRVGKVPRTREGRKGAVARIDGVPMTAHGPEGDRATTGNVVRSSGGVEPSGAAALPAQPRNVKRMARLRVLRHREVCASPYDVFSPEGKKR